MKQLKSSLVRTNTLSLVDRSHMFQLMTDHFSGVTEEHFEKDLKEKELTILLKDDVSGDLRGFSTYMIIDELEVEGERVAAIFSGDTIVDQNWWGCWELFKAFGDLSFKLHCEYSQCNIQLYWFLVSMGYKTYRLLPLFFREFYPRFDQSTPLFERALLKRLGSYKFGADYDQKKGVVHFKMTREYLRESVAPVTAERLKDQHVDFFCKINRNHRQGDELACVARFSEDNLTAAGLRMIQKPSVKAMDRL